MINAYSNPTDDNMQSEPDMFEKVNKMFSEAIFGFKLFIPGNACEFAIFRMFFVCFFFDIEKWDF